MKFNYIKSSLLIMTIISLISCQNKNPELVTDIQKIHSWSPRTLYRDFYTWPVLSPDALKVAYILEGQLIVIDIPVTKEKDVSNSFGYDRVSSFSWLGKGEQLKINGYIEGKRKVNQVYFEREDYVRIPENSWYAVWSKDGKSTAYYCVDGERKGIWVDSEVNPDPRLVIPNVVPRSMSFSNNGTFLAVISKDDGISNKLSVYNLEDNRLSLILDSLDAESPAYFTADDKSLIMSMVSNKVFNPENTHKAVADRDLDLYTVNIENMEVTLIYASDAEDIIMGINGNEVYWSEIRSNQSIGIFSIDDGEISIIISENAYNPTWHPDGTKLSATYGQFRLMDFPLNWDITSIELDNQMHPKGNHYLEVSGYHEDMAPTWSPSGKKIAYHSHRSPTPVTSYTAPGSTDGIWIKETENNSEFIFVNPGHETGICDWSPDGKRIVFTTVVEGDDKHRPYIANYRGTGELTKEIIPLAIEEINGDIIHVVWSPTSDEIAFEEDLGGFKRAIWTLNLDKNKKRKIVEYKCMARWGGLDYSPDGKHIFYSALAKEHHQIFNISLENLKTDQVTEGDKELFHPQVSPDGRFIACSVIENQKEIWSGKMR